MRRAASRATGLRQHALKRWPYRRRSERNKDQAQRRARRAGSRYLLELTAVSLFAFIGTALFTGLPLFRVQPIAVTWEELADARYLRVENDEVLKLYDTTVKLNKRPVALRGFVTLLDDNEFAVHFVLSATRPGCPRCYTLDSQHVEVFSSKPIRYSSSLIVLSGRLAQKDSTDRRAAYQLLNAQLIEQ